MNDIPIPKGMKLVGIVLLPTDPLPVYGPIEPNLGPEETITIPDFLGIAVPEGDDSKTAEGEAATGAKEEGPGFPRSPSRSGKLPRRGQLHRPAGQTPRGPTKVRIEPVDE